MDVFRDKKTSKNISKFCCEKCDFVCSKIGDWKRHITTHKHINVTSCDANYIYYTCNLCEKVYNSRNGLWYHKKKCELVEDNKQKSKKDLIQMLIDDNKELRKILIDQSTKNENLTFAMMDIIKNGTHHTNSHNKTFNLQFFLNETCKDAMNITDFVDSIVLQLSDLEKVGDVGFIHGISNIIVTNLYSLDESKRPIHCTDVKREVLYVKDENKWEKESEHKEKIRQVIKKVAHKNTKMLNNFKDIHPDCLSSDSIYSDKYNNLVIESLGGIGNDNIDNEDKIIKIIAKEVNINK